MGKLPALILVSFFTCFATTANAQGPTTLQVGTPIERALGPGQVHEFTVKLEENTYMQVSVEQHGIDVIVKTFSPANKSLGEFDSPTGTEGSENVSFVAATAGTYRLTVGPLDPNDTTQGRYQIKILELRQATDQELKASKNQEAVKAKGLTLLTEIEGLIAEIKSPQTRIRSQLQAYLLLRESDEKRASKYLSDAIVGVKEFLATLDPSSQEHFEQYSAISQLRQEIVGVLVARDPDAALDFMYATVPPPDPSGNRREQLSQENALELTIANQIMSKDPSRALQIARRNLKTGYSSSMINILLQLRRQKPELAAEFANEIVSKLLNEKLLKNYEAASVASNLLRLAQAPQGRVETERSNLVISGQPLLPEDKYRELFQKILTEALSYTQSSSPSDGMDRQAAWNMLQGLQRIGPDLDTMVTGGATTVTKKMVELMQNPQEAISQEYQKVIANNPADTALEAIAKAPLELREQLYMQLANRELMSGDSARAKQIINDHVNNPYQRRQALTNIEQQDIYRAINQGKVDEALRAVSLLRTPRERAALLSQIAGQIGPGQKRANAINLLEQARSMLSPSPQAPDEGQMRALFEIGRAFSRYDSKRAFEIIDPLIDQVNELCAALRTLEGFGGDNYEDEELNLQNGNTMANLVEQMSAVLGNLALTNFERSKAAVDRIRLPEIRLRAYLEIAQQTSQAGK